MSDGYTYAQVGAARFPLDVDLLGNTITPAADPAKNALLDLMTTAINCDIGEAWDQIVTGTSFPAGNPVNSVIPFDPSAHVELLSSKRKLPMLACWRVGSAITQRSIPDRIRETTWRMTYTLPECTQLELARMADVLTAVEGLAVHVIQIGKHPAYSDGYSVIGEGSSSGIRCADVTQTRYGRYDLGTAGSDGDPLLLPTLEITFETWETISRWYPDSQLRPFEGATHRHDLYDDDGTPVDDFTVGQTENPPTKPD